VLQRDDCGMRDDLESLLARYMPRLSSPLDALELLVEVRGTLDRLERIVVDDARRSFATWEEIGRALGVSRQAAHRRHRGFVIR
jgi:hypothetical protein